MSNTEVLRDALTQAIQAGAPVYNQGRADQCYAIYKATAAQMLESGIASGCEAEVLRSAMTEASTQSSPSDAAWSMRRGFDAVLDGSASARAQVAAAIDAGASSWDILDFSSSLTVPGKGGPRWGSMDDGVMGGMSSSSMLWDPSDQAGIFSGNVTTQNNGGFASIRSTPWTGFSSLGMARGVRLTVKGDGQTYKLTLKEDDGYDGVNFQHDFLAPAGIWRDIDLPLAGFKPNFRGRMVEGRPPVNGARVRQVGIMLSKFSDSGGLTQGFKTGPFRLALRSIKGFR